MNKEIRKIKKLLEGKSIQQATELLSEEIGELSSPDKNILYFSFKNHKSISNIGCYATNEIIHKVSFCLND